MGVTGKAVLMGLVVVMAGVGPSATASVPVYVEVRADTDKIGFPDVPPNPGSEGSPLPLTGADASEMFAGALLALVAGAGMTRKRRADRFPDGGQT